MMKEVSLSVLIVVALLLIAAIWLNLSRKRKRIGWQYAEDPDDFVMPCEHTVTAILAVFDELMTGHTRVAIIARCKQCNASLLDRVRVTPESDGRLHIENATDETICVEADGELHHLRPASERHPAQATLRPIHGGVTLDLGRGPSRHDPETVRGFGSLDDEIDDEIGDRDPAEGDRR